MPQDVNEQPKNVAENIDVESQEQAPKKDAPNVLPKQKAGPEVNPQVWTTKLSY
ncbi:hypothetical protein [Limosilactobacillus fermentum]|uniref:hypothetical protein n=1 Tax=Limosilactobacillus fermentum TaxID=1613 RepID=UPI0022E04C16|nr:hypothetical protein [Limosilactobacillus fermentum]